MSWTMQQLGEVIDIVMGQAPASEDCNFEKRGVPFVKAGEFGFSRPVIREWTTNPLRMAKPSDVLLCVVGATCGKINLGEDCAIGRSVAAIRPNPAKLDQFFLHYFLMTFTDRLREGSTGAAQTVISKEMISSIEIPRTPLPEQQRIVGKLDAAFAALTEAQAHVERNRANAQELFESYLNGVFEGKGDGWVEKRLGDLIDIQNGYAFSSNEYKDEGHFLIRISNVQDGEIILANPKYVAIDDPRLNRFILNEGDILVSLTGNIGRVGVMLKENLPAALNQRVARITLKDEKTIRHNFLFFFLRSNFFREHLQAAGHGAAQQNVSTKEIAEVELSLPPLAEQQRVLDALRELQVKTDALETTYQQKLLELAGLKKAVLGAAFRGEL